MRGRSQQIADLRDLYMHRCGDAEAPDRMICVAPRKSCRSGTGSQSECGKESLDDCGEPAHLFAGLDLYGGPDGPRIRHVALSQDGREEHMTERVPFDLDAHAVLDVSAGVPSTRRSRTASRYLGLRC